MKKLFTFAILCSLLFINGSGFADPCRGNSWQPTFVEDLGHPDGPYFVMPGLNFTPLNGTSENQYVEDACRLIDSYGLRDKRRYTTCQAYTKVKCGCDAESATSNSTCKAFLSRRTK